MKCTVKVIHERRRSTRDGDEMRIRAEEWTLGESEREQRVTIVSCEVCPALGGCKPTSRSRLPQDQWQTVREGHSVQEPL